MNRILPGFLAISILSGCAGEAEMRSVSGKTAEILNIYRSSLQEFAASQSRLNAVTEARLTRLTQLRGTRQAEISARVDSWKLAGDAEALRQFDVATGTSAEEILANASPQLPPPGLPALKYESAEVDALIKPLIELKKPVSPKQRAEQLLAYGTSVRETYLKNLADATKAAAEVATETELKSKATENTENTENTEPQ